MGIDQLCYCATSPPSPSHLSVLERGHLQVSVHIRQRQLQTGLRGIDGDTQLGSFIRVGDVEEIPGHYWRLPRPERALEAKLVRKAMREGVHGAQSEIRFLLQTIRRLQLAGAHNLCHTLVIRLSLIEFEFTDDVKGVEVWVAWTPSSTRCVVLVKVICPLWKKRGVRGTRHLQGLAGHSRDLVSERMAVTMRMSTKIFLGMLHEYP